LVLAYDPAIVAIPPATWDDTLRLAGPLVFPAADPQAQATLAFYLASGGAIQDDAGRPSLDPQHLEQVLRFYQTGESSGLLPFWLTQYASDQDVWAAVLEGEANFAITHLSHLLAGPDARAARPTASLPATSTITASVQAPSQLLGAVLPTVDGIPYTLATGWVWAVASPHPELQGVSVELAEFLTESAFLAEWTQAAGYLPPRVSALAAWVDTPNRQLLEQIALSAHLIPAADLLSSLAPSLKESTVAILKEQSDPATLAEAAAAALSGP
jgi:ABC-type glycerol-3-phosphate transport system substrate-binding protein